MKFLNLSLHRLVLFPDTHFSKPYYGRDPFGHFRRIELPEALLSLILISEKIYLTFIK